MNQCIVMCECVIHQMTKWVGTVFAPCWCSDATLWLSRWCWFNYVYLCLSNNAMPVSFIPVCNMCFNVCTLHLSNRIRLSDIDRHSQPVSFVIWDWKLSSLHSTIYSTGVYVQVRSLNPEQTSHICGNCVPSDSQQYFRSILSIQWIFCTC